MSASNGAHYAIRIDATDFTDKATWLNKDGGAWWAVKELEDSNSHFHIHLYSSRNITAVRRDFQRSFPDLKGNGAYSITAVRDVEAYDKYMAKGGSDGALPEVVGRNGIQYSDDWVQEQHEAYWETNRKLASSGRKLPILDFVVQECKRQRIDYSNREKIAKIYIKEQADRNKPINTFAARSAVNLISLKLCPDDTVLDELAGIVGCQR